MRGKKNFHNFFSFRGGIFWLSYSSTEQNGMNGFLSVCFVISLFKVGLLPLTVLLTVLLYYSLLVLFKIQ